MNSILLFFRQFDVYLALRLSVEVRALDIPYSHRKSFASDAHLLVDHNRPNIFMHSLGGVALNNCAAGGSRPLSASVFLPRFSLTTQRLR